MLVPMSNGIGQPDKAMAMPTPGRRGRCCNRLIYRCRTPRRLSGGVHKSGQVSDCRRLVVQIHQRLIFLECGRRKARQDLAQARGIDVGSLVNEVTGTRTYQHCIRLFCRPLAKLPGRSVAERRRAATQYPHNEPVNPGPPSPPLFPLDLPPKLV